MNSELINHLSEELITAATRLDPKRHAGNARAGVSGSKRVRGVGHLGTPGSARPTDYARDFIARFGYLNSTA